MMIVPGSAFIPKAASGGDPYWGNVVLLMHMDGVNNSTSFIDETGKTITPFGAAKISTAQSKFGGASAYFDGSAFGALRTEETTDFVFGAEFTIEYWVDTDQTQVSTTCRHVCNHPQSSSSSSSQIRLDIGSTAGLGTFSFADCSSGVVSTAGWIHVAATRSAGTDRLFLNGILVDSATSTNAWTDALGSPQQISVGSFRSGIHAAGYTKGYIDELRITKGVARYTADFTPPTTPFPNY